VANIVEGRTLLTEMWVLTSSYTYEMAKRAGLLDIIQNAGGNIVPDTCIDQPCWRHLAGKRGATDSPKCAYYTRRRDMRLVVRDLKTCVEASLKGSIE
jgi:predicted aconitase